MKQYDGEKAIISLTSWKARINTVSKTIYSLIQKCPGFHIVLCLSEEEFPKKEEELPDDLMLLVDSDLIEILWVYKNYKAFKKVIFTMEKYKETPIISADDDCIYTCNYAEELYNKYVTNKNSNIKYCNGKYKFSSQGPATLYSPVYFDYILKQFYNTRITNNEDDGFMEKIFRKLNKPFLTLGNYYYPYYFHDEIKPINGSKNHRNWYNQQAIFNPRPKT